MVLPCILENFYLVFVCTQVIVAKLFRLNIKMPLCFFKIFPCLFPRALNLIREIYNVTFKPLHILLRRPLLATRSSSR